MTIDPSSLGDMLLYVSVVAEGSFTRAAAKHGTSKQVVSARVSRLESVLGVRLLERTTRRVRPTDIGAVYFQRSQRIAQEVDEAFAEARSRQLEPSGVLRISAPYLFGRRFLGPIVANYMREFPRVAIELVLGDHRVDLVGEGFDLAIRAGRLEDSSLTSKSLGQVRISTVVAPAFLAKSPIEEVRSLTQTTCIGLRREEEWRIQGQSRVIRPQLVVNDLEIACSAAVSGLGVAHLPELVSGEHLRAGRLLRIFESAAQTIPVYVVYPSRKFLPAKVQFMIDRLAAVPLSADHLARTNEPLQAGSKRMQRKQRVRR